MTHPLDVLKRPETHQTEWGEVAHDDNLLYNSAIDAAKPIMDKAVKEAEQRGRQQVIYQINKLHA